MKKIIALLLVVCTLFIFASCSAEAKLKGTWVMETDVLGLATVKSSYTFNDDGTGSASLSAASFDFTYAVEDGNLILTYNIFGVEKVDTIAYTVDGDKLTIDGDVFTKQK